MSTYIEEGTHYAYIIKHINNISFNKLQVIANKFISFLPEALVEELYSNLHRGVDQIKNESELYAYIASFGYMHAAKLHHAFKRISDDFNSHTQIDIIDYGCGQAIGSVCYADYLHTNHITQAVRSITLVEPSRRALGRAVLHVSSFFPNTKIFAINKGFDELTESDFRRECDVPTMHIFSNVLDLADNLYNLEHLVNLIKKCSSRENLFICVGPYFGYPNKDLQFENLFSILGIKPYYHKIFSKGDFIKGRDWTCQVSIGIKKCVDYLQFRNVKTARQLIKENNDSSIDIIKSPKTGKLFFTCGDIKGCITRSVTSVISTITIDDVVYVEILFDGKYIPCLVHRETMKF